ncbi:class I SAM-dependent methyltransferase [Parashewanella curva]|uniref:Class I SAM-dependent methyltransferase n=1 Tax=Parashewanella curva TaxID=2338552 RepID=A0A3L8PZ03_9GAMM|nr:class I SAM-dependent methyltransferase [Parashewanella curva]RLV60627.1 class I SAM-dependent methyltransferase [Parashewanella curva]
MKLNTFEKFIVNSSVRFWVQNLIEMPTLMSMFAQPPQSPTSVLEIGCGYGNGIEVIKRHLNPEHITAIDFDDEMVTATRKRFLGSNHITIKQADAAQLPFENEQFDMVFEFAVFHHVPDWQKAVQEVYRVLKPNGYFVVEDLYRSAICNPISKRLFEHPQTNRFDHSELVVQLVDSGFKIIEDKHFLNLLGAVVVQKI